MAATGRRVSMRTGLPSAAVALFAACAASLSSQTANAQGPRCAATVVNAQNAGDVNNPMQLVSGCPTTVLFERGNEELYLYIQRDDTSSVVLQDWDMEQPASTLFMYDWEQPPHINDGARFQWYFIPAQGEGDLQWRRDVDCRGATTDCYHCQGDRCSGVNPQSNTGRLYITLSNQPATATSTFGGDIMFQVQPPRTQITDDAKFAVQSLWQACCAPTYYLDNPNDAIANAFDPEVWQDQNGNDQDQTPYCYWNPLGAQASQHIDGNGPGGPLGWAAVGPQDCELLNHVQCDADGNIAELSLSGLGLKCDQLPDLPGLSHIKNFHAANNQISGTIPLGLTVSRSLEQFQMTHNFLDGTIPCFASTNLDILHLEANLLTGTIPACLMGKPSMEQLHLATNFLEGTIPARWGVAAGETSNLVSLNLKNANLEGPIPTDMSALTRIVVIDLSLNHLSGPIPPSLVQDSVALYRLHLSHNELTGTLPQVGQNMQSLKILRVDNNHISGGITSQFDYMRQFQVDEIVSSIWLQSNSFSGALPRAVYSLTMGEPYIRNLNIADNHFYCEKDTGTWPIWAMRLLSSRSSIGTCEPVPRIDRIEPAEMAVGEPITVFGSGFMATDDFRCKFGTSVSDALFDSPTQARCIVPDMPGVEPGQSVVLTMANYGEDWSGSNLISSYTPTSFTLSTSETCSGHGTANADGTCVCDGDASGQWSGERCDMKETNPFLVILLVFMVVVAVGFGIFIFVLISKEKKGDPLFMSLMEGMDGDSGGGMGGDDGKNFAMGGMTVEGAEPSMPPPPPGGGEVTTL